MPLQVLSAMSTSWATESGEYSAGSVRRVSRVLHDLVGHHIVQLMAQTRIWIDESHQCTVEDLKWVSELSEMAARDLRLVVSALYANQRKVDDPDGIEDLLKWLLRLPDQIPEDLAKVSVTLISQHDCGIPPETVELIERIVRESVSNAVKYSPGGRMILILQTGRNVQVTARSEFAAGPRPASWPLGASGGTGISALIEAISRAGGNSVVKYDAQSCFTLDADIPLPEMAEQS